MPHYRFTKTGPLFDLPINMPKPGPYYVSLLDARELDSFPAPFALYFSTDHHHGDGGIWLYLCDGDPSDPKAWSSYDEAMAAGRFDHLPHKPEKNPILQEHTQGDGHTETPYANLVKGKVLLSYHKNNLCHGQATLLALSEDGVNFERLHGEEDSVILRHADETNVPHPHTGYFRWAPNPFPELKAAYIGYSLYEGAMDFKSAMWVSPDAREWTLHHIFDAIEGRNVPDPDTIFVWHGITPESIRPLSNGNFAVLGSVSTRAAGSMERIVELYEAEMAPDGVSLIGTAEKVLPVGTTDQPDSEEIDTASLVELNGVLHGVYIGTSDHAMSNTVMGITGTFEP